MLKNIEAEQGLLGCIFQDPDLIQECTLMPEHVSAEHRSLFEAIREIDQRGDKPDILTVISALKERKCLEEYGADYPRRLAESVLSLASFKGYQRMIYEAYRIREMHRLASVFAIDPTSEKITELYERAGELQEIGIEEKRDRKDIILEIANDIATDQGDIAGVDTGFTELNNIMGGLQDNELTVVAARPSVGKTTFALNLARNAAEKGCVVDVFSLEMPEKSLVQKIISAIGNIDGSRWKNPFRAFTTQDHVKWVHASGLYSNLDLYIHDEPRQTVADIRAYARKTKKDHPEQKHLIVIDYLQLLTPVRDKQNRNLEVGEMTRELKNMAQEFSCPIVLLSQLSRNIENRQNKQPMLSDLRDSGSVEQDANNVIFLHREDYYDKESEQNNLIQLIIAKQRNGPLGTVDLAYIKEYSKFANLERRFEYAPA